MDFMIGNILKYICYWIICMSLGVMLLSFCFRKLAGI